MTTKTTKLTKSEMAKTILAYNSILRTADAVAARSGEHTNWELFSKRVYNILKEHHQIWLKTNKTYGEKLP